MPNAVAYHVSAHDAGMHRFHVRVTLAADVTTVTFPSWAPGSYLMREFARNVRDIFAHHLGAPVRVIRTSRNCWNVRGPCTLEYDVYAREKSVRTPFVDDALAFFLPSNLLVHADPLAPCVLTVDVPAGHAAVCPLGDAVAGPGVARWTAADLDQLNDSPVAIGPFEHVAFDVLGIPHHHWIEPGHNGDVDKMAADLKKIVLAAAALFGNTLPYPRYDFITLHLKNGHGGLEHKDGSVLLHNRLGFADPKGYEEFVTLAAHEHFHAWNVKRLHPDTLGPHFRYDQEHYTRVLWWLEGGTVYYEERVAYRAGLVSRERHLERLAELATRLAGTPGQHHQSLEDSSFDAWIKLYRPGEDSNNSGVSYYLKGAVVLWAMDLELLARSDGRVCLDDLLRALWAAWGSHGVGFPEDAIEVTAQSLLAAHSREGETSREQAGDWSRWYAKHIRGTDDPAVAAALDHVGLDLVPSPGKPGSWLGIELSGATLTAVREGGPSAGVLSPGDELIAVNGERSDAAGLADRLRDLEPGTPIHVTLSRDGRMLHRMLQTGAAPSGDLKIVERANSDPRRTRARAFWLGDPPPPTC